MTRAAQGDCPIESYKTTSSSKMDARLERIRIAYSSGDHITALRLAAKLKRPPTAISKAWSAYQNPGFYSQLGHDVPSLIEAGIHEVAGL